MKISFEEWKIRAKEERDKLGPGSIVTTLDPSVSAGVYRMDDGSFYCFMQQNALIDSDFGPKFFLRNDAAWRGALKGFFSGPVDTDNVIAVEIIRWSKSRKSVIVKQIKR